MTRVCRSGRSNVLEWLDSDQGDLSATACHRRHSGLRPRLPEACGPTGVCPSATPRGLPSTLSALSETQPGEGEVVRAWQRAHSKLPKAENRPDYPLALSDKAIASWIDSVGTEDIVRELQVTDQKRVSELTSVVDAIRVCSHSHAAGGFGTQLDALANALIVTDGKSSFDERRSRLARELLI